MPETVVCENLVAFLYELMRDHLPMGVVREAVSNSVCRDWKYSDEALRQIAWDMAYTLQNGK